MKTTVAWIGLGTMGGPMAANLARASSLTPADLLEVLESGLGSPYFRAKGVQILSTNFSPQFTVDLVRKDLGLIREALEAACLSVPTLGPIAALFDEAARRGWGGEDGAAAVRLLWGPEPPVPEP